MRVSRERAAEHHERIVETAARLYRQNGFDGVGLDAIMREAGLTHGGFYRHFHSKDDLATEALAQALRTGEERQSRFATLRQIVRSYLSEPHRADRARGCAIAALGGDMARQSDAVRTGFTAHLRARIAYFASLVSEASAAKQRQRAIATLACMVGALTLARAVNDPDLAKEILTAARDALADGES